MKPDEREALTVPLEPVVGPAREGELLLKKDWREAGGRYGAGDYVTRDGNDVHLCVELYEDGADMGVFQCVVEPPIYEGSDEPWIRVGEEEHNLTRRYSPVDWKPNANSTAFVRCNVAVRGV